MYWIIERPLNYRPQTKFGARLYFYKRVSRILFTMGGGGSASLHAGIPPPPPARQTPPAQYMLGDTVNKRAVCILLECNLVLNMMTHGTFVFLPAATKLWPRLCFYTCLWFCPWGGSLARHPPWDQADTPRDQADTPLDQAEPPRDQADTTPPLGPGRPPRTRQAPPPDQADTVNERPVRILLECILFSIESPKESCGALDIALKTST